MKISKSLVGLIACFACCSIFANAGKEPQNIQKIGGQAAVLGGFGGNIGVYKFANATVVVDTKYAPLDAGINRLIHEFSSQPIKYVINTHWHWDHVGGDEGLAHQGAQIIAHKNVLKRMRSKQESTLFKKTVVPYPKAALPTLSFDSELVLCLDDNEIVLKHFGHAHTNSDSIIFFKGLNIIQMGDIYFSQMYPRIDYESGGSVKGMIEGVKWALSQSNDKTIFIPGHGKVGKKLDVEAYLKMLSTISQRVSGLKEKGKSLQDIQNSSVTKEFDARWNNGRVKSDSFLSTVFMSKDLT